MMALGACARKDTGTTPNSAHLSISQLPASGELLNHMETRASFTRLQEQNLHATARQLFIHRNTLVYRLQRIRTLLQLDLDDAAVRNVLRTGCILLEYYQGAF